MMHYYYGSILGLGGGIFMFLIGLAILILLIWAIWSSGRRHNDGYGYYPGHGSPTSRNSGLDVLNERYAKGEITKEEYEQKKKDILS
jgi:putative membrane protein